MNAPARAESPALHTGPDQAPYGLSVTPIVDAQVMLLNPGYFNQLEKVATFMAKGKASVPKHLQGNPTDCFSVVATAARANLDPFGVARRTWQGPNGTLEYEAQLVIALINNSGLLSDRLRWEWFGPWEKIVGKFVMKESRKKQDEHGEPKQYLAPAWDPNKDEVGLGVRCIGTIKGEAEPRVLELLLMQARVRNSSLWVEDPKQQLAYLASKRWGRLHTPEAIMGMNTPDDRFDPSEVESPLSFEIPPELMQRAEAEAKKGVAAYQAFWKGCTLLERALLSEQSDEHERLKKVATDADAHRTVDEPRGPAAPTPAPTAAPASATPAPSAEPTSKTYAEVVDLMNKATDPIAVEIAAEWIEQLPADQQADANKIRDRRLQELGAGA